MGFLASTFTWWNGATLGTKFGLRGKTRMGEDALGNVYYEGGKDTVGLVGGRRWVAESITDVPLETGAPEPGRTCDRLLAVPFRQVAERGFVSRTSAAILVLLAFLAVMNIIAIVLRHRLERKW